MPSVLVSPNDRVCALSGGASPSEALIQATCRRTILIDLITAFFILAECSKLLFVLREPQHKRNISNDFNCSVVRPSINSDRLSKGEWRVFQQPLDMLSLKIAQKVGVLPTVMRTLNRIEGGRQRASSSLWNFWVPVHRFLAKAGITPAWPEWRVVNSLSLQDSKLADAVSLENYHELYHCSDRWDSDRAPGLRALWEATAVHFTRLYLPLDAWQCSFQYLVSFCARIRRRNLPVSFPCPLERNLMIIFFSQNRESMIS